MEELVKIDRTKWQKPSYLGHYDENATHYEGLRKRCSRCEISFVFSANAQKVAFEEEKRYPGWLPTLCASCELEWKDMEQKIKDYQKLWEVDREVYESDVNFLKNWLAILRQAEPYRKKNFDSRIRMLKKAIEELA